MLGIVTFVDPEKPFALLSVGGHPRPVVAHFRDVKNCKPRRLDYAEVVTCQSVRDGSELKATDIRVLTGIQERVALARIIRQRETWAVDRRKR